MKVVWIMIVWLLCGSVSAQIDTARLITTGYFSPPVDHQMKLAGSFGELRSNHFHAGIDIKSKAGTEGDTIRSAAPGHVSRVKLQRGSYGKALYIDHPNGYTTVYAHLQKFSPQIEAYIRRRQRAAQSYELDVYLHPDSIQLDRGQFVGLLGNTGRSYGPHLHFEIRHTKSETPQNPYLHGIGPTDGKAPLLYAVKAEGMDVDLNPITSELIYLSGKPGSSYGPAHHFKIPAWRAAMSIQSFDQMDGSSNSNGLYQLKMYVDDSLQFAMQLDSVHWDETKYINSFIDYTEKKANNRTLIRCYKQKSNRLTVYQQLRNNGFFKLYRDKPRHIRFEAIDLYGNTSSYECQVSRSEEAIKPSSDSYQLMLQHDKSDSVKVGPYTLIFAAGSTDNKLPVQLTTTPNEIQIGSKVQPIFKSFRISSSLSSIPTELRGKAVIVYTDSAPPTSFGGTISNDSLHTMADKLGKFSLVLDTVPPTIQPLEYKKNATGLRDFKFRLMDNFSTRGAARKMKYDVYIDGNWIAAELKVLGHVLTVPLSQIEGGSHQIKLTATDHSDNTATWTGTFSR